MIRRLSYRSFAGAACRLLFLPLTLAGAAASVGAGPTPSEVPYHCDVPTCTLGATLDQGSGLNTVDWDRYTDDGSGFDPFGYDLHFTASNAAPPIADNATRIDTGVQPGYVDQTPRCGGYYHVRAYSRGRKTYSEALSSPAPGCDAGDDVAPTVAITAPPDGAILGAAQLFEGTASDEGGSGLATVRVEVDAAGGETVLDETAALAPDGSWSLGAALGAGGYTLRVTASDGNGNVSVPETREFSVEIPDDTLPPTVAIDSPSGGAVLDLPATASGTASDEGGSGVVRVDIRIVPESGGEPVEGQATLAGGDWTFPIVGLADGNYTLVATAVDGANNVSEESTVDFGVENVVLDVDPGPIVDGYPATEACGTRDAALLDVVADSDSFPPTWQSEFDAQGDFHQSLIADGWNSRYPWRQQDTDVVTNNESQSYLDALGYDAHYRDQWSPFRQVHDADGEGYLAILAEKSATLLDAPAPVSPPLINGEPFDGQPYVSGVLTTYDAFPALSPGTGGTLTVELRARMPRGQGVFPAFWAYPIDYAFGPKGSTRNDEFDLFEYIGQSPDCTPGGSPDQPACTVAGVPVSGWRLPPDPAFCTGCPGWRDTSNTYDTQYHNYHKPAKGKLRNIGAVSGYGAVYTNADGNTPWRGDTWAGCDIDFSEKVHTYTLQWSGDRLAMYIDHIKVLEVDEAADGSWLPGIDFVPVTTEPMALILNFALSSAGTYIGAPDGFTQDAMDDGRLMLLVDYVRFWQH